MPEDAGKLEVEYVIISAAAMRRLERLQKQLDKVEKAAGKHGDAMKKASKQAGTAMAAFGAIVVGVLYSVIKSSSYASMWMDQLRYTTMRLADKLLEITGLKNDIDDFFRSLDGLVDKLEKAGDVKDVIITVGIKAGEFVDWFSKLTLVKKIIYSIIAVIAILTGAWAAVTAYGLMAAGWIAGLAAIKSSFVGIVAAGAAVIAFLATLPMWVLVAIGALIGLIAVWILWKTGVLEAIYDLGAKFRVWLDELREKFGIWVSNLSVKFSNWISGMRDGAKNWVTNAIETFGGFKTHLSMIFDNIWSYIIKGLKTMKTDFFSIITSLINKVSALIKKILSIPAIKWGGGDRGTTEPGERSGDWGDAAASGAHIVRSGVAMVHQGEDIVNLNKMVGGIRTGENGGDRSITINNTINITGGNLSNTFEANRVATTISKRMGDELKRISTSI